jgi:hypothetical protein
MIYIYIYIEREREREREREDSSNTSLPIMLIPLLLLLASPPTKAASHQPFSREVKESNKNLTDVASGNSGGKYDPKLMKDVRCLTCRQRAQRLTVQSIVERERERESNETKHEERETGHVYSTVFQSSISTSIDKEGGGRKIQYQKRKRKPK